jgi:hypothetical protein
LLDTDSTCTFLSHGVVVVVLLIVEKLRNKVVRTGTIPGGG